jgi:hypothetical protein
MSDRIPFIEPEVAFDFPTLTAIPDLIQSLNELMDTAPSYICAAATRSAGYTLSDMIARTIILPVFPIIPDLDIPFSSLTDSTVVSDAVLAVSFELWDAIGDELEEIVDVEIVSQSYSPEIHGWHDFNVLSIDTLVRLPRLMFGSPFELHSLTSFTLSESVHALFAQMAASFLCDVWEFPNLVSLAVIDSSLRHWALIPAPELPLAFVASLQIIDAPAIEVLVDVSQVLRGARPAPNMEICRSAAVLVREAISDWFLVPMGSYSMLESVHDSRFCLPTPDAH